MEVGSERMMDFLDSLTLPSLSEEHITRLETPVCQEEIMEAIKVLKTNTAPGPDEFTPEFYQRFRDSLHPYLTDLFAVCAKESRLPGTWAGTKGTLLSKHGKDPSLPQTYRPIPLFNVDYNDNFGSKIK